MIKLFYGFAFLHHQNSKGGYHHIGEYLDYDIRINVQKEKKFFDQTLRRFFFLKIFKWVYSLFFNQIGVFSLVRCCIYAYFKSNIVFHFIYPENTYAWLHYFLNSRNKIVFTLHQPKDFYLENKRWINILKKINTIVILDKNDIDFFKKLSGKDNVYYIPHGVNTNFFHFNPTLLNVKKIVMVGNWLRNFRLASSVFQKLKNIYGENLQIIVVTNKENYSFFKGIEVQLLTNISDLDLLELYQTACLVYFPLLDFTANNSLLEAAACGAEILISTDKEIKESYIPEKFVTYLSNDEDVVVDFIQKVIDREKDIDKGKFLSEYIVNNYSWPVIAKVTKNVLIN